MKLNEKKTSAGTVYYTNESGEIVKKQCTDCKHVKSMEDFGDKADHFGGKRSFCKECAQKRNKDYRLSSIGRVRTAYNNTKATIKAIEKELDIKVPDNLKPYHIAIIQGYDECSYCGKDLKPGEVTLDHVKPFRSGGTNDFSNVLPSCKSCNSRKSDKPLYSFLTDHVEERYKKRILWTLAQRQLKDVPTVLKELQAEAVASSEEV